MAKIESVHFMFICIIVKSLQILRPQMEHHKLITLLLNKYLEDFEIFDFRDTVNVIVYSLMSASKS